MMMMNLEQAEKTKRRIMIRKGKRKIVHDVNTDLIVKIGAFTKAYKTLSQPYCGTKNYRVVAYTDLYDRYRTPTVKVSQGEKLKFNKEVEIPLDCPARYLYIELLRLSSWKDPGTSDGTVVMGRAKIRLPHPTSRGEITRKASIVALNSDRCVVEKGTLEISMKLYRYIETS